MSRFANKAVLITGAASGIGAAAANQFSREGASVALVDRAPELLHEVANECREQGAPQVLELEVNQTDAAAVADAVESAWAELGRIDALFANAGYGNLVPFLEVSARDWQRHVDVNLTGTFHVCQEVARRMAADRGGGAIVINASSGAEVYADQLSAYCSTKAATRMLAIGMASELGVHRVRVNAILPGVIETGMTAPMLADDRHREVLEAETPVGRLGTPQDVAKLVCFLASDDAEYMTGAAVRIDGGQTIHGHPRWFRLDYSEAHEERWEIGR